MDLLPAVLLTVVLVNCNAYAGSSAFPEDFKAPADVFGGAGGGGGSSDRMLLSKYPVVMVSATAGNHRLWTGGDSSGGGGGSGSGSDGGVYGALTRAGFHPVELWMIDFAPPGKRMTSLEEATDDLKHFITAVMLYTGADRVQVLAFDTGCILSRLTILKYRIAHWIESEVYIGGPFHGIDPPPDPNESLLGFPNSWCLAPGSTLLDELRLAGETPIHKNPITGSPHEIATLTIRNGLFGGDHRFDSNPDSPALLGAVNMMLPDLDHGQLRTHPAAMDVYIPFLDRPCRPYSENEDVDGDGFRGASYGGPDCDDADPLIYPGAAEIAEDGKDQDCNGADLYPGLSRDGEIPLPDMRLKQKADNRKPEAGSRKPEAESR